MIQKILDLFRRTPKSEPIISFTFPTGNSRIHFPANWRIIDQKKGESTFTFFNEDLEGILYASELTNSNPEYQYNRQRSLEINSEHNPELIEISKYGVVLYSRPDEPANVTYKHYEIGFGRTLLQFTWMTPEPDNELLNQEIEAILGSIEIE
ncbi:hypothetical protein [Marinoscillum sp.]|uniref:hypothetical protein n=1 Tax=Marinoscillum sp. TaxID=2024838 RepID=UPI003BA9926D